MTGMGYNEIKKDNIEKVNLFKTIYSNYNAKYKKFEGELKNENNVRSIRCCSPYIDIDQVRNKEMLESKSKWVSSNDFKKTFGKRTAVANETPMIEYSSSPYTSKSKFTYRDTNNKSKWISNKNFQAL